MKKILLSIIIPVYNSEKSIKKCISSIVKQKRDDVEVIIVDDGSSDNTANIIKEMIVNQEKFVYIYQENKGSGEARNKGIEAAKGEFVTFVDSDDYVTENFLSNICHIIASKTNLDLIVWGYNIYYKEEEKTVERMPTITGEVNGKDYLRYIIGACGGGAGPVCCKAYRRGFVITNNLKFGEYKTAEDGHYNTKCLLYVQKIYVADFVGYVYIKEDYILHSRKLFFNRPHFFESSVNVTVDRLKLLSEAIDKQKLEDGYRKKYIEQRWISFENINQQNSLYNINIFNKLKVNKMIINTLISEEMFDEGTQEQKKVVKLIDANNQFKGIKLWCWNCRYRGYTKGAIIYLIAGIVFAKETKRGKLIRKVLKGKRV